MEVRNRLSEFIYSNYGILDSQNNLEKFIHSEIKFNAMIYTKLLKSRYIRVLQKQKIPFNEDLWDKAKEKIKQINKTDDYKRIALLTNFHLQYRDTVRRCFDYKGEFTVSRWSQMIKYNKEFKQMKKRQELLKRMEIKKPEIEIQKKNDITSSSVNISKEIKDDSYDISKNSQSEVLMFSRYNPERVNTLIRKYKPPKVKKLNPPRKLKCEKVYKLLLTKCKYIDGSIVVTKYIPLIVSMEYECKPSQLFIKLITGFPHLLRCIVSRKMRSIVNINTLGISDVINKLKSSV